MTERLVRVYGALTPAPLAAYTVTYSTPSFEVELEGSHLVARLKSGRDLDIETGPEKLEEELDPLLSSLAVESGWAVRIDVDRAEFVEDGPSGSTTSTHSISTALADAVIASVTSGAERRRLLLARIDWATRDPIYRDLLDFFTEAKGAANPRPALTSLWERLEVRYGGEDAVKRQLSISRAELRAIKSDQPRYVGDRHATYAPGLSRLGLTRRLDTRRSPSEGSSSPPTSSRSSALRGCRSRLSRSWAGFNATIRPLHRAPPRC